MLSVLLACVLIAETQSEPRLEWSTFGDFAAKQFEGSEYRLVMDRAIGERPMVYYFSNPGSDKLALLKRVSNELCLNFDVDDKLKKIFISGPNSDAGMTLRMKLQLGIQKTQEIARSYWGRSTDELGSDSILLIERVVAAESEKQKKILMFERDVVISMVRPESRAVLACLLTADPATLASRIAANQSGERAVAVSREATNIIKTAYTGRPPSDPAEADYWQAIRNTYDEMATDGAVPVITHSVAKNGAASFFLRLDGKSKSKHLGAISLGQPDWLLESDETETDSVPADLANEEFNPKQTIFWGVDGMNIFQTLAIKHKWNTVAWLDVGRSHPEFTKTIKGFSQLKEVRVKLTEDGWMVPYILGSRWPEFSGNWRGLMKMEGKIEPETDIKILREYLEDLSDDEINGMAEIKGERIDYRLSSLVSSARLIRVALRISAASNLKEFEYKLSQLDLGIGAEISHYWPYVINDEMKTPQVVQRRGQAILIMLDREVPDPDFDELPHSRTLVVTLAVPTGTEGANGKPAYAFERCEVILKKTN